MLWLGEKANANESALNGLLYKVTSSNQVNDDAIFIANKIASMSAEVSTIKFITSLTNINLRTSFRLIVQ